MASQLLFVFAWRVISLPTTAAAPSGVDPLDMVPTPFGHSHRSCVYEWPNGTHMRTGRAMLPNGTVVFVPPCLHQVPTSKDGYSGWAAAALAFAPSSQEFAFFRGDFNVPPEPAGTEGKGRADMTYIFNSLENDAGDFIIQPVLEFSTYFYGAACKPSAKGRWSFRSFAVDSMGNQHCGPSLQVSAGDTVRGVMKKLSEGTWQIWSGIGGRGHDLRIEGLAKQTSAQFVVELYDMARVQHIPRCEAYPRGATTLSNVLLRTDEDGSFAPRWSSAFDPLGPSCGQEVDISGSDVEISAWHSTTDTLLV